MDAGLKQTSRTGLLVEPTYGYRQSFAQRPTLKQLWMEWLDAVSFWRDGSRILPAFYVFYHLVTMVFFVWFFVRYGSPVSAIYALAIASVIATVYNTVWYHRYCTHRAFKFRRLWMARVFLWLNPVCFREESYVIPHRIHHSKSDQPGDPYGPHLGWLGSYLATESQQKLNRHITQKEYDRLAKSLEHIGFPVNSYEQFQRAGSIEVVCYYVARAAFANLFWPALAYI